MWCFITFCYVLLYFVMIWYGLLCFVLLCYVLYNSITCYQTDNSFSIQFHFLVMFVFNFLCFIMSFCLVLLCVFILFCYAFLCFVPSVCTTFSRLISPSSSRSRLFWLKHLFRSFDIFFFRSIFFFSFFRPLCCLLLPFGTFDRFKAGCNWICRFVDLHWKVATTCKSDLIGKGLCGVHFWR